MTAILTDTPLLSAATADLGAHLRLLGPVPWQGGPRRLIDVLRAAGLTGRGGAAFPTWRKIAAVAVGRQTVVIANGAEGEPASRKDYTLLRQAPHLVLDGLQLAAESVGAERVYLYAPAGSLDAVRAAATARRRTDRHWVDLVPAGDSFLAGEESAVVAAIEGRTPRPRDKARLVVEAGVRGRPTLVQNVETLAQLALIARHGPDWFRSRGTADEPGTFLATVSGAVGAPGVYEVPYGMSLGELLDRAAPAELGAVLIGGYHGAWVPADTHRTLPLSRAGLARYGGSPGAGVIVALPVGACPLAETTAILTYLAGQSSRQCGPCRNGLPTMAHTFQRLAQGSRDPSLPGEVLRIAGLVTGRGACHHPDGTARLAASALRLFADDVSAHLEGRCARM